MAEEQGAREITIPYRANRAVLFNSDLFHETDDIAFKEDSRIGGSTSRCCTGIDIALSSFSKSPAQTGRLNRYPLHLVASFFP